ncbi:hypothetical protein [Sutterella sp.]|uniref:hypothetical protein n=1 Tax=Sutterella sp. TaxID=1981025 RepID=UPI0026DF8220|nr:hypothetical protein [Sutterella sp.]MDO5531900.1 hypothetical protein [Sutterella sp.]
MKEHLKNIRVRITPANAETLSHLPKSAGLIRRRNALAALSLALPLSLVMAALLWGEASAMPGAPMMKLAEISPACPSVHEDGRKLVMHEPLGPVWENDLPDYAEVVMRQVKHFEETGEIAKRTAETKARMTRWADAPRAASQLGRAQTEEAWTEEIPRISSGFGSITRTAQDVIAALAGAETSAAVVSNGSAGEAGGNAGNKALRTLLLINGDDAAQRQWAFAKLREAADAGCLGAACPKVVLLQGRLTPMRRLMASETGRIDLRLFFDQAGSIRRRLGIRALPAEVRVGMTAIECRTEVVTGPVTDDFDGPLDEAGAPGAGMTARAE